MRTFLTKIKNSRWILIVAVTLSLGGANTVSAHADVSFSSGTQRVSLLELFTSQGCSSSPPAERWLNNFADDKRLWTQVVPVAFHVDYWDKLGWPDPFSAQAHTQRQYQYKRSHQVGSVYTPGFVLNGKEWRGWFSGKPVISDDPDHHGVLTADLTSDQWHVRFSPKTGTPEPLQLHAALLGFGIQTDVTRGENRGETLKEDFVVLQHKTYPSENGDWTFPLLDPAEPQQAKRYGMAFWVTPAQSPHTPWQATGGWLPENFFLQPAALSSHHEKQLD